MVDVIECSICRTKSGDASNLENRALLVNEKCGHYFCSNCAERQFARKRSFSCPKCKHEVKRIWLSSKSLEQLECEKDVSIRKMVKDVYNKIEKDFTTLLEFQNYEEEVEDIVFNLVHGIDVDNMRSKIETHKAENAKIIGERNILRKEQEQIEKDLILKEVEESRHLSEMEYAERKREKIAEYNKKQARQRELLGDIDGNPNSMIATAMDVEGQETKSHIGFMGNMAMGRVESAENVQTHVNVPQAPSVVDMFLNQKELPKLLVISDSSNNSINKIDLTGDNSSSGSSSSSSELDAEQQHARRQAGGFSSNDLFRRQFTRIQTLTSSIDWDSLM